MEQTPLSVLPGPVLMTCPGINLSQDHFAALAEPDMNVVATTDYFFQIT